MTWVEAYSRCMDGEFFRGEYCPRDGHSNDTSAAVARLVAEMRGEGVRISIEELVERGFDGDPTQLMVAEFADAESAPDWLRPEG
jgi:hypothetical protein